jgi:hypothetical protein
MLLFVGSGLQLGAGIDLLQYWPYAVVPSVLWMALMAWRFIAVARARRRDRSNISPMSREEVRKARSKLHGRTNPVSRPMNRPTPRPPDTYLKY